MSIDESYVRRVRVIHGIDVPDFPLASAFVKLTMSHIFGGDAGAIVTFRRYKLNPLTRYVHVEALIRADQSEMFDSLMDNFQQHFVGWKQLLIDKSLLEEALNTPIEEIDEGDIGGDA